MARNTYKQDENLEEPFQIKHLLRASSYIKKWKKLFEVSSTMYLIRESYFFFLSKSGRSALVLAKA